ncbi:glycosyltransferase [Oligoflexia bacterium]|nr:glycosyltransferase [Oligoflexia bacterium]
MTKDCTPLISVVIPARNEAAYLPACLASIQKAAGHVAGTVEIIVALNRCTDGTEQIAKEGGCEIVQNDSKNLAQVRNTGARAARGEILVTIDADSTMSEKMLSCIYERLSSSAVVGGGVLILPSRWSVGIFFSVLCLLPIALFYRISCGLFYCYRHDFFAIGGFNEELSSVEDIDFAKRLRQHGKQTGRTFKTIFEASITTSCRKFDTLGDWFFLRHPFMSLRLLRGKSQSEANRVWYDIDR